MKQCAHMAGWLTASYLFFAYVLAVAVLSPISRQRNRRRIYAGCLTGLLLAVVATEMDPAGRVDGMEVNRIVLNWIIPPCLLLIAYWTSGYLFVAPMPRVESMLLQIDRALRVVAAARRTPRLLAEFLEWAYAGVSPLIPAALVVRTVFSPQSDPTRFWTVILAIDYICFAWLPWIQTRPPRALDACDPWTSKFRRVNRAILGTARIQVNTFPSGHAAVALAAALLVINATGAPWPVVIGMFVMALAVSAGAVLGRYHYAADVVAGWIVAIAVWSML